MTKRTKGTCRQGSLSNLKPYNLRLARSHKAAKDWFCCCIIRPPSTCLGPLGVWMITRMVVNWIHWQKRKVEMTLQDQRPMKSQRTMFFISIVSLATCRCGCQVSGACRSENPKTCWQMAEFRSPVKLRKESNPALWAADRSWVTVA